jgi:heptosyltransferase-2
MTPVNIIKFLDKYIGFLICLILSINKLFPKKGIETKNILLIQLWGLGESILTLPAIKTLREKYPKSKIDILVTDRNKDIYFNNKNLNNIRVISLNPFVIKWFMSKNFRKYDLVIDMEEYLNISSIMSFSLGKNRIGYNQGVRSLLYAKTVPYNDKQHVVYTFLDLLKPLGIKKTVEKLPGLNYSSNDKKNIDKLLKNYKINKKDFLIGFGVGAAESAKSRMWPKERFAKLADKLIKKYNSKILLIGSKNEKNYIDSLQSLIGNKNNSFNVAGKTNTREMFYLIEKCKLFIGNDSGPMHVAAAQGTTTIGLFGCNLPVRFAPFGKKNHSIYKKNIQNACINVHKGQVSECKHGIDNACVKKIQVDDVLKLITKNRLLSS